MVEILDRHSTPIDKPDPEPADQQDGTVVIVDTDTPDEVSLAVVRALEARPWLVTAPLPGPAIRMVMIVRNEATVRQLIAAVRQGQRAPDLVVAWEVPEYAIAHLLVERIPVVDSSLLEDPEPVLEHLREGWTHEELREELAVAEALNALEEHVEEPAP
jgi:hypothetical protein